MVWRWHFLRAISRACILLRLAQVLAFILPAARSLAAALRCALSGALHQTRQLKQNGLLALQARARRIHFCARHILARVAFAGLAALYREHSVIRGGL